MADQILEQRANKKQETKNIGTISRCHYCEKKLQVPKNFSSLTPGREYNGFYKSPLGHLYCSNEKGPDNRDGCFRMFTED